MAGSNGGANKHNPALTNAQIGQAVHDYRNGRSAAEIAAELGVTAPAIHYRLRQRGIEPRRHYESSVASPASVPEPAQFDPLADLPSFPLAVPGPWADEALCAQTDSEIFFPDKGGSSRAAKDVCGRCPVRQQCLEHALATGERFGIWGGTSERERRKLTTQQKEAS